MKRINSSFRYFLIHEFKLHIIITNYVKFSFSCPNNRLVSSTAHITLYEFGERISSV